MSGQICGIDEAGLLAEIERYNGNAEQGVDPDFGRGQDYYGKYCTYASVDYDGPARTLKPIDTPPYYAAEIVPVVLGTMGGIKTDARSHNGLYLRRL